MTKKIAASIILLILSLTLFLVGIHLYTSVISLNESVGFFIVHGMLLLLVINVICFVIVLIGSFFVSFKNNKVVFFINLIISFVVIFSNLFYLYNSYLYKVEILEFFNPGLSLYFYFLSFLNPLLLVLCGVLILFSDNIYILKEELCHEKNI